MEPTDEHVTASPPQIFTTSQKLILAGLYLSKFDEKGLVALGFKTFTEAFNTIGLALKSQPATVKNYRDEFDPYFPNHRLGWHKREMRLNCRLIYEAYKQVSIDSFTPILKSAIYTNGELDFFAEECDEIIQPSETFAKRIITGQAAERFFATNYRSHKPFSDCAIEDTTHLGCGFDFRLVPKDGEYFGVEVKGLSGNSGSVILTQKEYTAARILRRRFFLYIVRNFCEKPFGSIYPDPLHGELRFAASERTVIERHWHTNI